MPRRPKDDDDDLGNPFPLEYGVPKPYSGPDPAVLSDRDRMRAVFDAIRLQVSEGRERMRLLGRSGSCTSSCRSHMSEARAKMKSATLSIFYYRDYGELDHCRLLVQKLVDFNRNLTLAETEARRG